MAAKRKNKLLIISTIISFIIGIIVMATGYDMIKSDTYSFIPSVIIIIAGLICLFIAYFCGFTIWRNYKDKLNEFLNE